MSDLDLNKDYYQILGVSPDAKLGDLKQAHREAGSLICMNSIHF